MKKLFFLLSIASLLISTLCTAQVNQGSTSIIPNMTLIDKAVKDEMDKQHITGLSMGIVSNGKVVAVKGYGLANIEHNIPATQKTVYKIGSVSKHMIATALMLFVQQNKLKLSDSLPKYFKDAPGTWNKITVRHLLNHTSGLPRESPIQDNMDDQPDSIVIKAAYTSNLLFEPGTSWRYCNLGYFMLADIIRQLSKQPFPEFMRDSIFRKFGLNDTRTTSITAVIKNRAEGYVYRSADSIFRAREYIALRPSGAFISSIDDLLKWELLLQSEDLLSKSHLEQMWNDKVKVSSSTQEPVEYYGYGWDVNDYKGVRTVHHDGSLSGFRSSYFRFIDSKSAVIILTNADNAYPRTIALRIAELMFR